MSDTVKLIIEIPKKVFEARKIGEISPWVTVPILDAVQNGISLDTVKAEIKPEIERAIGDYPTEVVCSIIEKHIVKESEEQNDRGRT